MAEIVYRPVVGLAQTLFKAWDLKIDCKGSENIPRSGGAVLVSNHISYLDFIFDGLAALPQKRLVRFMAKESVFRHKISGPLMRGMKHIPVDRNQGETAYAHALESLRSGEIVGVFPEATISQSFTLKSFKSGAARMAQEAGVPLIPVALWGTQRLWTKGHPRNFKRSHTPVTIRVGEAIEASATSTRARSPGSCASASRSSWRPLSAPTPSVPRTRTTPGGCRPTWAARLRRRSRYARPRPADAVRAPTGPGRHAPGRGPFPRPRAPCAPRRPIGSRP